MELHAHCYVGAGDAETGARVLRRVHLALGEQSSDVHLRHYAHFGIEEAREVRERAHMRGLQSRRIFIISAAEVTTEAQHALLKTFEEPPADAMFILLVPSPHTLLPTLLSRVQFLDTGDTWGTSPIDAEAFLAADAPRRLEMLGVIVDSKERDVASVIAFLCACERAVSARLRHAAPSDTSALVAGARAIYRAREYIADKGSLIKPLLEHVALSMPRM